MSSPDNISSGLIAVASIGAISFAGYTIYKCYKKKGSLSMQGLTECLIEGTGGAFLDIGKGLAKSGWDLTKKGGKIAGKFLKKEGNQFKDHVINPVGNWSKRAAKDTGKYIVKAPTKVLHSTEKGIKKMFSKKAIKKSFSKKNIKKTFRHLF